MAVKPVSLVKFDWGLNTWPASTIKNNQFSILRNFYYNKDWEIETRRGYTTFSDELNDPITSYFFYQNDWTLAKTAVCHSGTQFYQLDSWVRTSKKTGLTAFETATGKTTRRTRRDYAVYKNKIYMCDWINNYAEWDWTTYSEFAWQPKIRYISYLQDRLYGSGDDTNPNSMYYTWALPANWQTINTNTLVVWWDENWQINSINELQSNILAFKSNNIYAVNIVGNTSLPIDTQGGWYADRSIHRVWDSLVYFSDNSVETLKSRSWVTWSNALSSLPLSAAVKEMIDTIKEFNYNAQVAFYGKKNNNYYFSYDSNEDNIPDTTLVYSSLTKWRSEYTYPNIYDYWTYVDDDNQEKYVFASGGQMYEMETGTDDNWLDIDYELQTKAYDFDTPGLYKTVDYVDITGLKNRGSEIEVTILMDWNPVWWGFVTDTNINLSSIAKTIWVSSIWVLPLGWWEDTSWIDMYQYTIRVPMYWTGTDIAINMKSTGWVRTLQKARVSIEQQEVEVFNYNNIL